MLALGPGPVSDHSPCLGLSSVKQDGARLRHAEKCAENWPRGHSLRHPGAEGRDGTEPGRRRPAQGLRAPRAQKWWWRVLLLCVYHFSWPSCMIRSLRGACAEVHTPRLPGLRPRAQAPLPHPVTSLLALSLGSRAPFSALIPWASAAPSPICAGSPAGVGWGLFPPRSLWPLG